MIFQFLILLNGEVHQTGLKRNLVEYIACVTFASVESRYSVHSYRNGSLLRCNSTCCFLANYTQPLPSALMRQQLPGQFVFFCFSVTIPRTSRRLRALAGVIAFFSTQSFLLFLLLFLPYLFLFYPVFFQRAIGIDTVQRIEKFPFDRSDINVFYFELFKDRRRNVQELERYTSFATFFDHITSCNCMKCSMTKRIFQRRILRLCSALLQRCTNRFNLFKPVNQATLVGQ